MGALCCLALLGASCADGEDEAGPAETTGLPAQTTGTSAAPPATEGTTTTAASTTTTSWGVRPDRALVGPSGMVVDLNGRGEGWDDLAGVGAETVRIGASGPTSGPYAPSIGVVAQQPVGSRLVLVVEDNGEDGPNMQRAAEAAVAQVPSVQRTTVVIPRDGSGIHVGLDQVVATSPTAVVAGLTERGGGRPCSTPSPVPAAPRTSVG